MTRPAKKVPASQAKRRPAPPPAPPEEELVEVDEDGYLIEPAPPAPVAVVKPVPAAEPAAPPPPPAAKPFLSGFATLRDLLLFLAGMAVIANEVFISDTVDPTAVGLGVALTGAPLVFGANDKGAAK